MEKGNVAAESWKVASCENASYARDCSLFKPNLGALYTNTCKRSSSSVECSNVILDASSAIRCSAWRLR